MKISDGPEDCDKLHLAIRDTLTVIGGKWKLPLIAVLLMDGKKHFNQLSRELDISPRMLSRELAELELNQLVLRETQETKPVTVVYTATEHCKSLIDVVLTLNNWGALHRKVITRRDDAGNDEF